MAYKDNVLIGGGDSGVVFWSRFCGQSHFSQSFDGLLADGLVGDWLRRKSVTFTELYSAARFVKNVFLLHTMDAIFIFDDGYILAYEVYQFKPIWAARPTVQMYAKRLPSCCDSNNMNLDSLVLLPSVAALWLCLRQRPASCRPC
jgi:hypothetical protein